MAVGLRAAGLVQERYEQRRAVAAIERVSRQLARRAVEIERQDPRPMRRPEFAVRGRDLEVARLGAGVWVECSLLEPQRRVHRVVGQAGEGLALGLRNGAASVGPD